MKLRKYTEDQLKDAILNSTSLRQTLLKLNVVPYGGNYDVLRKAIAFFNLDSSHFTGQGWAKNKTFVPRRKIEEYLSNQFPIQSYKLKNRLFKEGIFKRICSSCNGTKWLGHPIPLELDHISGNSKDNRLSNLRLLCPNCHAQTPTYRGKNKISNA